MIAGPDEKTSSVTVKQRRGKPQTNPRSLSNLKPFKPGESGNPNGRPPAGLSILEWLNQMESWTREQLESVLSDTSAPVSKLAAARSWLDATVRGYTQGGNPVAGNDFDRILDRTIGKPAQSVDVTSNGESVNLAPVKLDGDREL